MIIMNEYNPRMLLPENEQIKSFTPPQLQTKTTPFKFNPVYNQSYMEQSLEEEDDPITEEELFYIDQSFEDLKQGRFFVSPANESAEELLKKLKE